MSSTRTSENQRDLFVNALAGCNRAGPPVWLMRQAGRYMPEYRALREKYSIKELWNSVDLAVEVSLQPHEAFDVDALIVFYDILLPLEAMGCPLEYTDTGPVFLEPVRDQQSVDRLHAIDPARDASTLLGALRVLARQFEGRKAVLGFAGAPLTLSSYLVEGRLGQGVRAVKRMMFESPGLLHDLLDRLTTMTIDYLAAQAETGVTALQLFDSWAGDLAVEEFREFVLPYYRRIFDSLGKRGERAVPVILYIGNASHLLEAMNEAGADALSVDWRVSLADARFRLGDDVTLQGNLDPSALFASPDVVHARVEELLRDRAGDPAYIFNLGHGVLPGTPVESVRALVDTVKAFRRGVK
jgi:uroporphyrinogen decarboxylase